MARALLSLLLLSLLAPLSAHAWGTVVELHWDINYSEGKPGAQPVWILPSPVAVTTGSPPGCTNLPPGFMPASGRFYWNNTAGVANCHFIWFFYDYNCVGGARGVQVPSDMPKSDNEAWVSQDSNYAEAVYYRVQEGKSVGCSFEVDPCKQFPCSDPSASCNSSLGWSFPDEYFVPWAQQTRDCSQCKTGYTYYKGKCTLQGQACKDLNCQSPSKCTLGPTNTITCECPNGLVKDSTGTCRGANDNAWLNSLNSVRQESATSQSPSASSSAFSALGTFFGASKVQVEQAPPAPPLAWNENLAASAKNWTVHLNQTQCGQSQVTLSKMPDSDCSESDVWVSWSDKESDAVNLWAPSPDDWANPRTVRIIDSKTQFVGCGKTTCGPGAFFTCLFWPKTL